jgi:D-arabinose 1-dehydrogenase-like Zn-dependent alcohol dehydrogenase
MEAGNHHAVVPVDKVIGRELEILGSHGMQAHRYPEMTILYRKIRIQGYTKGFTLTAPRLSGVSLRCIHTLF